MAQTAPGKAVRPVAATFRAQHRGGGLYSEAVSQRAGSWLALAAYRLGLAPATVTLTGLVVGLGSSVALIVLVPASTAGGPPPWLLGVLAGLGWQLAYALDCADGQLARVTGRTSAAGARLDILCDVAVQIGVVAGIVAVAAHHTPTMPVWLGAVFAGTWMVNVVTSVLASGGAGASLMRSTSTVVRVVKLIRDYGAVIAACAVVIAAWPAGTWMLMYALSGVNGAFLVISIVQSARSSLTGIDAG